MKKRLLSLFLTIVMVVGLLPATALPVAAADNVTTPDEEVDNGEPFGIPTPGLVEESTEYDELWKQDPFAKQGKPFVLDERSELYMTYGSGDGKVPFQSRVYDWNSGGSSFTDNFLGKEYAQDTTALYNSFNREEGQPGYVATAAMMSGRGTGGKNDLVAQLYWNRDGQYMKLNLIDPRSGTLTDSVVTFTNPSTSSGLYNYGDNVNFCLQIACGDFDGDGVDSVIFPYASSDGQYTYLREQTYKTTSSSVIADSATNVGNIGESTLGDGWGVPGVSLAGADVDKDGYDELVALATCIRDGHKGCQLFVFDKIGDRWLETAHIKEINPHYDDNNAVYYNDNMQGATMSVGDLILSTGSVDYPEILITGNEDYGDTSDRFWDDCADEWCIMACTGPVAGSKGGTNIQGEYGYILNGQFPSPEDDRDSPDKTYGGVLAKCYSVLYSNYGISRNLCFNGYGAKEDADGVNQLQPDVFFWNGGIYQFGTDENDNTAIKSVYRKPLGDKYNYGLAYDQWNQVIACQDNWLSFNSLAAGNFMGTDDMRQQIIIDMGYDNMHLLYAYYVGDDGEWAWTEIPTMFWRDRDYGYYATVKYTQFSLCACDYDDDSAVVRLDRMEREWSQPTVVGILECVPYFEELWYDLGESITTLSTSTSSGTSEDRHNCITGNTVLGFEHTVEILEGMPGFGGGFELTYNRTRTWDHTTENTITKSFSYGNNSNENQVVMSRMPTVEYIYEDVNTGAEFMVGVTSSATTSMIPVSEYNEAAEKFGGMDLIDESKLCTPGDPSSYPMNTAQIQAMGGSDIQVAADSSAGSWGRYSSNGEIEMSIGSEDVQSDEYDVDNVTEFTAYAIVFGFKAGGGAGGGKGVTTGTVHGNAIDRTGAVQGPGVEGYDFEWNFVTYNIPLNGQEAPVLGYMVRNIVSPPSPPSGNITVNDVGSTYVDLAWELGSRPADQYIIYMVNDNSAYAPYVKVGQCGGDQKGFKVEGLDPLTTYTFVVRGYNKLTGESYDSSRVIATTTDDSGNDYVTINPLTVKASTVDQQGTISTSVFPNPSLRTRDIQFHWQRKAAGDTRWEEVPSSWQDDTKLTIPQVTQDMDGDEYRLMVVVITTGGQEAIYYSETGKIDLTLQDTQVTDFQITGEISGGTGTNADPLMGSAAYAHTVTNTGATTTVKSPATFTVGEGGVGSVYQIGDQYVGLSGNNYYKLTKAVDGDTYSVDGEGTPLARVTKYQALAGSEYSDYSDVDAGVFKDQMSAEGTLSDAPEGGNKKLTAYVLWDGTTTSPKIEESNLYWRLEEKTETTSTVTWYTSADKSNFAKVELGEKQTEPTAEGKSLYPVYQLEADVDLEGSGAKDTVLGDRNASDTFYVFSSKNEGVTTVYARDEYTVSEETKFFPEDLEAVYTTRTVTPNTTTTTTMPGTTLHISAKLTTTEGRSLPADTKVQILVTNEGTGVISTHNVTTDSSGTVSLDWSATKSGSYSFRVVLPAQGAYKGCVSTGDTKMTNGSIFYLAGEANNDGSLKGVYRLSATVDGKPITGPVGIGQTVTLTYQMRKSTEDAAWQDIFNPQINDETKGSYESGPVYQNDGLHLVITAPSGKKTEVRWREALSDTSRYQQFELDEAGSYLVQWYLTSTYANPRDYYGVFKQTSEILRASTTVTAEPKAITVTPTWEGAQDGKVTTEDAVTMQVTMDDGSGSLPSADKTNLEKALELKSNYFDLTDKKEDNHGTFEVYYNWVAVDSTDKNPIYDAQAAILGHYTVTLKSGYIRNPYQKATVSYTSGEGGNVVGYIGYSQFDSPGEVDEGATLKFTAAPIAGYQVMKWEINGEDLTDDDTAWSVEDIPAQRSQQISVDFALDRDTVEGEDGTRTLEVKAYFTNEIATVTYSVGVGSGTLTAKTQGGTDLASGNNISSGSTVIFTAAPGPNEMVDHWTVKRGEGAEETYTFEGGDTFRENVLTLEDIREPVEVKVYYEQIKYTTVNFSMVTDTNDDGGKGDGVWDQSFGDGTITATYNTSENLASGTQVEQGTPVTFTVKINNPDLNEVHGWQYRTADDNSSWTDAPQADWVDASGTQGQTSYTFNNPDKNYLEVRVLIDRAQTYDLSWEIKYQGEGVTQETSGAVLTVTSRGEPISAGQHTAHIPVEFTLKLNPDYYVVKWEGATAADYSKTAKLESLTEATTVKVTVAEKPKVTLPEVKDGNSVTVTGTYDGVEKTWTLPSGDVSNLHYDPGTSFTVKATPADDYYVGKILEKEFDPAHGEQTHTSDKQTTNFTIAAEFKEKPSLTLPDTYENGTLTVTGTFAGKTKTWTVKGSDKTGAENLHFDPGTDITVKVEPNKGYVLQDAAGWTIEANSDDATRTYKATDIGGGLDINDSHPTLRALDKITVHFFVISEGGWKEPGTEGAVAHGTLSANVSRKGIDTYNGSGATNGVEVNDPEAHTLELYEGGSIVLTAEGTDGNEHGSSTQNPHNVSFWSADKDGNYTAHYQKDGESEDYFGEVLTITYEQLQSHATDGAFYIGVSFAQAAAKVSYHMVYSQRDLGSITAAIDSGANVPNRGEIGMGARVTFTADITDEDHYEVKYWIVDGEPTSESGTTFTYTAEGRNVVVELELQGKVLDGFEVKAGENGRAAGVPENPRYKESVELTATPDAGYQFEGWYLNGTKLENAGATYTLTAEDNGVYEARFKPITGLSVAYAVSDETGGTIEALANDSIEFTSSDEMLEGGQKITLTLTLTEGWRQKASEPWSNLPAGAEVSDDKLTVTIPKLTGNITSAITANVEKIPVYTVTVMQPESTVQIQAYVDGELQESDSFEVPEGTIVTFKYSYVPGPSTVFNYWIVDGDNRGYEPTLELTIMGHTSVSINTNAGVMFNLTLEAGSAEGTTATGGLSAHVGATDYAVGSYPIPSGSIVTVTANPNADSMVKEWYIDDVLQKTESGRTFLDLVLPEFTLDKDTTVKVVFESKAEYPNPTSEAGVYTVTDVKSYPSGNNSGVTAGSYRKGGDLSFTITPTGDKDILIPYVDGFINAGENVTITENATGGWDVVIKNVTGEVELPNFRVNMEEGITKVPEGLKNQTVLDKLKDYLPDGVSKPEDLTGDVLTEVMERIVVDKMPAAPDSNKAIYDVELQRYDDKANQWVTVTDEDEFPTEGLTVILPYPEGTNRNDTFTVVHMFTVASTDRTHNPGDTETFETGNGLTNTSMGLQFRVKSLSPIAVAWTKSAPPAGGGGGGGAAATENPVTLPENVSNGSISSDKETAKEGAEVTLTVTPDWGYAPETVTVTDENGEAVEVKDNGDGTYTFTMPATGVKVSVTFGSSCGRDETCPMYSFEDAVRTAWYHDGVHYCLEKGLMDGVGGGKFAPDRTTTRAMLVTILYRLEGEPAVTKNIPFEDVPAGQWYSDAVVWAVANGIVKGYNDTEFGPTDTVTREQMAAILYRYSEYKKYDVTATSDLAGYKDADTVSGWADAAMRWAVAEGLIEGTTKTTLVPGNGSTRAMVATVLMRYCEKIAK